MHPHIEILIWCKYECLGLINTKAIAFPLFILALYEHTEAPPLPLQVAALSRHCDEAVPHSLDSLRTVF